MNTADLNSRPNPSFTQKPKIAVLPSNCFYAKIQNNNKKKHNKPESHWATTSLIQYNQPTIADGNLLSLCKFDKHLAKIITK